MDNGTGVFETTNRIIAIGDLHGDYSVLLYILLQLTKVAIPISELKTCKKMELEWNPDVRDIWLVFCGDLIDMKRNPLTEIDEDCDFEILETLFKLQKEAEKYNSKIIILLGNHEIMNFQNNFDYVPENAINDVRRKHFRLGSNFAKKIAKLTYLSVRIGNLIFIHGGFCSKFVDKMKETDGFNGLLDITKEIIPQLNFLLRYYLTHNNNYTNDLERYIFGGKTSDIGSKYGPLWCREQSLLKICLLNNIAESLNISHYKPEDIVFIVAHTPQIENGINSICNGKLWRIDIGMSRAFEENPESIMNFNINNLRDQSRTMGVLEITKTSNNINFRILTNNMLSRIYSEILRQDSIDFLEKYTQFFNKNKKKLKEAIPIIKSFIKN